MKIFLTSLTCCSLAVAAQAQFLHHPLKQPARPASLLDRVAAPLHGARTTATAARLVAASSAYYQPATGSYSPLDSVANTYSGGRGGGVDTQYADVQTAYLRSATGALENNLRYLTQYRTPSGTLPASRQWQEWNAGAGVWSNVALERFSYSGAFTTDSLLAWDGTGQSWKPLRTTITERNPSGTVRQEVILGEATGATGWDTTERYSYQVDGAGRYSQIVRQRDAGGTLRDEQRELYTYGTAAAQPTAVRYEYFDSASASWRPSSQFLYTLNGGGQRLTEVTMGWNDNTASWDTSIRRLYRYDATGFLDSIAVQLHNDTGGYRNSTEYRYTKNSYNLRATEATRHWNATAAAWELTSSDFRMLYYWEEYTQALALVPQEAGAVAFSIAPVPASGSLTMHLTWPVAQGASIVLWDNLGRAVCSWQVPAQRDLTQAVDLTHLAAGVYVVRATGADGTVLTQRLPLVR